MLFKLLFYTILFNSFFESQAQNQRLVDDTSEYLCINDSIAVVFENQLKKRGVDSIITVLYDYDNGRIANNSWVIFWSDNGHDSLRYVQGCDSAIRDFFYCSDFSELWFFISSFKSMDLNSKISQSGYQSHDMGYYVDFYFPDFVHSFSVRNYQRRNHKNATTALDKRVVFVEKLEEILKIAWARK